MQHCPGPAPTHVENTDSDTDSCFKDKDRASTFLTDYAKLYEEGRFTDIVLCVDNQKFRCHKTVLAVSSPYFMGMFSSNMAESRQDEVKLKSISPLTFRLILDYIYKGQVMLSKETVQNLVSASNMFQLISLRNGCADFMIKHLKVTNCIGVYFFARTHECDILAKKAKDFINHQIALVCKEQEFLQLCVDKVVKFLSDDQLNVTDEKEIFEACLGWLNHDLNSRKSKVSEVMSCVRFSNLSPYYFWDKVELNPLLSECAALRKVLHSVHYYHILRNRQLELDLNFMPRKGMSYRRSLLIVTYSQTTKISSVEELNFKNNLVSLVFQLPQYLIKSGCAVSGDNLVYVAGGQQVVSSFGYTRHSSLSMCKDLFVFDPSSKSWHSKANMNEARYMFPLTVLDSCIYAVGGRNASSMIATVEKYDIEKDAWQQVAPLPEAVCGSSSVGYKGKLYVFGGNSGAGMVKHSLRYDPLLNQWTALKDMSIPKSWMGSVVYKDQIYVIGGLMAQFDDKTVDCTDKVEIFNPASDTWSKGPSLPTALYQAGVVKNNNKILVVGGYINKEEWMASAFTLAPNETGDLCWDKGHDYPSAGSICGCVAANLPLQ